MSHAEYNVSSEITFQLKRSELGPIFHGEIDATQALDNKLGGLTGFAAAVHSDLHSGIPDFEKESDYRARKEAFGDNHFPDPKMPGFFSLLFEALKDEMLIILIIAAIVSLVLGIFFPPEGESWVEGSIEGAAILGAVVIVSFVQAGNNYVQEKQFQKLNKVKQNVPVKVIRGGKHMVVSIHDVLVGDLVVLETGNQVPADGFFISGHNCSANESGMTGESEPSKKRDTNRKMLSGTYIMTGNCVMITAAVGDESQWGKALAELDEASERRETPLQEKLGKLARYIGFVGMGVATVVFLVLVAYFIYDQVTHKDDWKWENLTEVLQYFIIAVTIVVVAVPEGLPLAVTMALAYSLMKMRSDMCLVRYLPACETMGGATQICSDKTGTLTQNRMTVTTGVVGGRPFEYSDGIQNMNPTLHHLLVEGIARNTTSYLGPPEKSGGPPNFVGQATECALLVWINGLGVHYERLREEGPEIAVSFPFSSSRKRMSCIIPLEDGGYRMYTKGASEIMISRCTTKLESDGSVSPFTESEKEDYLQNIEALAGKGLRTLVMAYRDFEVFDVNTEYEEGVDEPPEMKLTLIALVGIQDPVRPEVPEAVRTCQNAGITVRMVTGDNKLTASSIARECNILTENGIAIEGPEFSKMSDDQIDQILPRLQVLARSSPSDKIRLVRRLRANTELVAVTGDGTNDAPALRGAHIGLAMGGGTEVARDASDIIILDDNFSSIVKAVMWGRSVFDNIRKFLQFQLTVNVAAMAIAALSAFIGEEPLTAVQLLWVNLIMDSLGALALATEPPTQALLSRPPKNISHPKYSLISPEMWKMIIGQSIYQIFVLYGGLFLMPYITEKFNYDMGKEEQYTIIFNAFIFCQLFNLVACRKVNPGEYNIFAGFFKNWAFHLVLIAELVIQILLVGFSVSRDDDGVPERLLGFLDWIGLIFDTVGLNWQEWLCCIAIGFIGFLWGFVLRFIPTDRFFPEKLYKGEAFEEEEEEATESSALLGNVVELKAH